MTKEAKAWTDGSRAVIPGSVTSIEEGAFDDCTGLTSVTIPAGVTSIGDWSFDGCESLTSVTIPGSVTRIGQGAFRGCESLTSITIPDSVTSIGACAFDGCTGLTHLSPGKKLVHTSRGYAAHDFCGPLQIGCESHPGSWWHKNIDAICVEHAVDAEERTELEKLLTVF